MTPRDFIRLFESTIKVEPGEFKDLGDVTLFSESKTDQSHEHAAPSDQSNASSDKTQSSKTQPTTVRGIVTDADGKPVAGAKVYAVWGFVGDPGRRPQFEHRIVAETQSNSSGAFSLTYSTESLDKGRSTDGLHIVCLLYTSPSPRDATLSRMPSSA